MHLRHLERVANEKIQGKDYTGAMQDMEDICNYIAIARPFLMYL